jgi:release factor glutamine methyltransferase
MRNVTLADTLRNAGQRLAVAGVENHAFDARLLIMTALGLERSQMVSQAERVLNDNEIQNVENLISRREAREPVGRIFGEREFWSLPFKLNEATLEPRPDSETLVETVIKLAAGRPGLRLLDLGTGSGCLLLSLICEMPDATGLGIDIAPRAVDMANINAANIGLDGCAKFEVGNWMDHVTEQFDIVLSNPPYIPTEEIPLLMPEVRDHDPLRALNGGNDGLDIYRLLIPRVSRVMKPGGFVIFEVGLGQADAVEMLLHDAKMKDVTKYKDFSGIERCVAGWV